MIFPDLWPHQGEMTNKIENAYNSGVKSICAQMPTGSGKTRVIGKITELHKSCNKTIYIAAHRDRLVDQLSEEVTRAGMKHGIIKPNHPYVRYRVQVCSIQTLSRRLHKVAEPGLIIIDEAHHVAANTYTRVLNHWPNTLALGFTATPARPDGRPLSKIFDKLILGPQPSWLIDNGYLADYDYYAPGNIDMSGVKKTGGDFNSKESKNRVDKPVITGNAIEHYQRHADHMPAIASCVNIEHSEHVASEFRAAGYKARAVHSKMSKEYIRESINGLTDGSLEILCQCELLGEGVDIRGAVALIGLRPTSSLIIFLQHCGRVLRKHGDKRAVILDHVGNWERHGLPSDDREWTLAGKIKQDSGKPTKKSCPNFICMKVVPINTRICPACGYQWTETEEVGTRLPEEKEGKLVNIRNRAVKMDIVRNIARNASNLKQAIAIAKEYGIKHTEAWKIWTQELRNKA